MDLQRALHLILMLTLMSEKFQQVRIKIAPATDFTQKGSSHGKDTDLSN